MYVGCCSGSLLLWIILEYSVVGIMFRMMLFTSDLGICMYILWILIGGRR
jgi:hypothetical protein